MDQAPCHIDNKVKLFSDKNKRLHLFYLPPRSPQFNPDEQVWANLKNGLKSYQATNIKDLKKIANKKLSLNSNKVKKVFKLCDMHHLYAKKKCK